MSIDYMRYQDRARLLEALGYREVVDWMSDPPVQLVGFIEPEHKWFYFRARSGGASLEIFDSKPRVGVREPDPVWEGQVDCPEPEPEDDCYLDDSIVVSLVEWLVPEWRSGRSIFDDRTDR